MLRIPKTPWLFKKHQSHHSRSLTDGEVSLARCVFGDLIDYQAVKIINYPYVPWQSDKVFIAPNGCIFAFGQSYRDDYAVAPAYLQQTFIHEMTHVLQYQQGINVLLIGAWLQSCYYLSCFRYNPYRYQVDNNKSFWHYNIEQQGSICEDIWLGRLPNILCPHPKNLPLVKKSEQSYNSKARMSVLVYFIFVMLAVLLVSWLLIAW